MSEVVDIHMKKGLRPDFDIYIGRRVRRVRESYNSLWGNYKRDLKEYEEHIRNYRWEDLDKLKGKKLGCWCLNTKEITPLKCHGQILMKLLREKERVL